MAPNSNSATSATARPALPWWGSLWFGAALLVAFYVALVASVANKSLTADEIAHSTAGYSYWQFNDYRFNPENGNLPQRIAGLPLVLSTDVKYPSTDSDEWRTSKILAFGYRWYYGLGNDAGAMLRRGRAAIALLTVGLGVLVWCWSRRLFGATGGLVSLLLFVLSPTLLANGALMTSDAAASLCFLATVGAIWALIHRITPLRLLLSVLATAALFVTKASALLLLPIAGTLAAVRLVQGEPLPIGFGATGPIVRRRSKILGFAALAALHAIGVWLVIWASVGFRFSPYADADPRNRPAQAWEAVLAKPDPLTLLPQLGLTAEQAAKVSQIVASVHVPREPWAPERLAMTDRIRGEVLTLPQSQRLDALLKAPPASWVSRTIEAFRRHRILPESYLYGLAHASKHARLRNAFFNGEVRLDGWRTFFPYTFLVKTPLPVFAVIALAIAAAVATNRSSASQRAALLRGLYATAPLWVLFVFYWVAAISSPLNIGHRHIMATYPPLYILCGAAAYWWQSSKRFAGLVLTVALGLIAVEVLYRFPNYISYFNVVAGGPGQAYRHLVDSSLDWGQDLPAVRTYVERQRITDPIYLSYFGDGNPDYYGIVARHLYSFGGQHMVPAMQLRAFEAKTVQTEVNRELQQHPDYQVAGSSRGPNDTIGVLFLKKPENLRLTGGTYFISATMLQPVMYTADGPLGPWNARFEATYRALSAQTQPLLNGDEATRIAALRQHRPSEWEEILYRFEMFRFARLTAFLRHHEPTDNINGSILVYRLNDDEVRTAIDGPAPELGPDVPREFALGPNDTQGEGHREVHEEVRR